MDIAYLLQLSTAIETVRYLFDFKVADMVGLDASMIITDAEVFLLGFLRSPTENIEHISMEACSRKIS